MRTQTTPTFSKGEKTVDHDIRTHQLAATEAEPPGQVDKATARKQYQEGVEWHARKGGFQANRPRQGKLGWLQSDEKAEVMKTETYQNLMGATANFTQELYDQVVNQLRILGCPPVRLLAHVLNTYEITADQKLLDEIKAFQAEQEAEGDEDLP
jgi:hypothetical protein